MYFLLVHQVMKHFNSKRNVNVSFILWKLVSHLTISCPMIASLLFLSERVQMMLCESRCDELIDVWCLYPGCVVSSCIQQWLQDGYRDSCGHPHSSRHCDSSCSSYPLQKAQARLKEKKTSACTPLPAKLLDELVHDNLFHKPCGVELSSEISLNVFFLM